MMSQVLTQWLLEEPERREEILGYYRRLLEFFIENRKEELLFDAALMSYLTLDLTELRAVELERDIKHLFTRDLVDEFLTGDWDFVRNALHKPPNPEFKDKLPDLSEHYEMLRNKEDSLALSESEQMKKFEELSSKFDEALSLMEEEAKGSERIQRIQEPEHHTKVGRNEPCPCGSGKKYKKCYGKHT